jgi:hypothetical protein
MLSAAQNPNMFGKKRLKPSKEVNVDAVIKQAEASLAQVRQEAETLVDCFNQVIPLYAADLAQYLMRDAVTQKSEITQSLGETALHGLKSRLKAAIDVIPSQSGPKLRFVRWAHLEPLPKEHNHWACFELSDQTIKSLDEVVRDLISCVGVLLFEYGYERDEKAHPLASVWQVRANDTPRYAYELPDLNVPSAREFQELLARYRTLITEDYQKATAVLHKAIREKSAAEAQALWDKV